MDRPGEAGLGSPKGAFWEWVRDIGVIWTPMTADLGRVCIKVHCLRSPGVRLDA